MRCSPVTKPPPAAKGSFFDFNNRNYHIPFMDNSEDPADNNTKISDGNGRNAGKAFSHVMATECKRHHYGT